MLRHACKTATTVIVLLLFSQCSEQNRWTEYYRIDVPRLEQPPQIDADLSDWKELAFHDGVWDIHRLQHTPWYDSSFNRLTIHGNEPSLAEDLAARYYIAWDENYLFLGAEVLDNVNDVTDPQHEPKRWYFKDAICWFLEAPRDQKAELFGQGDNAFCFVIDTSRPSYGAWWRHGDTQRTYIEEPLPPEAVSYAIRMNPWSRSPGDFILEARVNMRATLGKSDPKWHSPKIGDVYGLEIVHTDPDGGDYGGHFLIYGRGDNDLTWGKMRLVGPIKPIGRKTN
jgi:hypothetical protein